MAAYCRVDDMQSRAGWDQLWAQRSVTSMGTWEAFTFTANTNL